LRRDRCNQRRVDSATGRESLRGPNEIRLREGAESLAAGDGESPAGAAQAFAGRGGVGLLDAL